MFSRLDEEQEAAVRAIAREEVASLCGLVLRRLGQPAYENESPAGDVDTRRLLREVFGEALNDFGKTQTGPGPT
jgi:hypothetical protein